MLSINKHITKTRNIFPYYYGLLASILFLWLAESYITCALETLNAWCICDLNKIAFGCVCVLGVGVYMGVIIWKYIKRNLYISHQYLCWWSIGIVYYLYYRLSSSHFQFWGFNILGIKIAFLDLILPAFVILVILKLLKSRKDAEQEPTGNILSDEPIRDINSDLFGYKDIAHYLKEDLERIDVSKRAFSVGITGKWGIGKSSFLNLFEWEAKRSDSILVRFYPRSSTKLENIQDDFFKTFSDAISEYHTNISNSITKYIRALKVVEGEGLINKITDAFESFNVENERDRICEAISKIGRKIYVIIEDLDRLSGTELLEVLKLIDRNGAFCNVIYISAYDKKYVNGVLKQTLGHQIEGDFTDKYFNYELPLPAQKTWVVKNYIGKCLSENAKSFSKNINYNEELAREWEKVGDMVTSTLGTIRHVKRFINLFMSRYVHVMDDVNVGDFLLLTLLRYSNVAVYDAIVKCQIVRRGGLLSGSKTTMYLVNDFENLLKEKCADDYVIDIVKRLFPEQKEGPYSENGYKRLRRAEFFEHYFYEKNSNKIYYSEVSLIFDEKEDDKALDILNELMNKENNWSVVEEYLYYRGLDWISNKDLLRRYIKLIIFAYNKTNGHLNYHAAYVRLFSNYSEKEFVERKAVDNSEEYSELLYHCLNEMIKYCCSSVGLMVIRILDEFRRNGERPNEWVLKDNQYTELAFKALKYYTEQTNTEKDLFISIKLSLIHPIGKQGILEKARNFITDKMNSDIVAYANSMFTSIVFRNSLFLELREPESLSQIFSDWNVNFPKWIKKLPTDDMQFVFNEMFEKQKRQERIVVKALKNTYTHDDYAGYRQAIENHKKQKQIANKTDQVFDFIAKHDSVTLSDISSSLNISKDATSRIVQNLVKAKRIEAFGLQKLRKYRILITS